MMTNARTKTPTAQPHTGEDDKDIRITIRQIVEGGDKD